MGVGSNQPSPARTIGRPTLSAGAEGGYQKLAVLMSSYPEATIFRRFGQLNMVNLLRLQAEIQALEAELRAIRVDDAESNDAVRMEYVNDFRLMRDNRDTKDPLQIMMLEDISRKLHEYNTAMLQLAQIEKLERPNPREVQYLRRWLQQPQQGNNFLCDIERETWAEANMEDLVTLLPQSLEPDAFTSFLNGPLLDIWHNLWGHRQKQPTREQGFIYYDDTKTGKISNVLSAVLASVLPTITILVLYFVKRLIYRIGLMVVFTAMFSASLALFTSARKIDIFSATAAFAAVEVVFIGSTDSGG